MADFVRLFGPSGLFHTFFKDRLEAFVDTSATPWSWRGTFGTEGIPSEAIAQFENADKIRRAFFPAGSESPPISINVKPISLSNSASAVMMEIEGERVVYFHGPVQSKSISWPSAEAANVSRIAFQPGGWQQALTENGDWSPFRLFDEADITNEGEELFRARFTSGGQTAEFDIQFGSVLNPFRLKALRISPVPRNSDWGAGPMNERQIIDATVTEADRIGFFGKVPTHGDFVSTGLGRTFKPNSTTGYSRACRRASRHSAMNGSGSFAPRRLGAS